MPSEDRPAMLPLWALGLKFGGRRWAREQLQREQRATVGVDHGPQPGHSAEDTRRKEKARAKRERRQARRKGATDAE